MTVEPPSLTEFNRLLSAALRGKITADPGLDAGTRTALQAIADVAPKVPAPLVRAARVAWRKSMVRANNQWRGKVLP